MGTPLYTTDIIPLTSRPTLTVMDDGDYFVILDTSTGKISKILKTLAMEALNISYDNTSGLTAETVQAALDELVVNLGSSDSAISALSGRLDTLEGTGEGSVTKAIEDALEQIETDKTLAVSGMAADAKVTGDKVGELKSAVNSYLLDKFRHVTPANWLDESAIIDGVLYANGTTGESNTYFYTDYIPVDVSSKIRVYTRSNDNTAYRIHATCYDANKSVLASSGSDSQGQAAYVIANLANANEIAYVRITLQKALLPNKLQIVLDDILPASYSTYFAPYDELTEDFLTPESKEIFDAAEENLPSLDIVNVKGYNLKATGQSGIGAYYVNGGKVYYNSTFTTYRYLITPVKPNTWYKASVLSEWYIFTDDNDDVISGARASLGRYFNTGEATKLYYTVSVSFMPLLIISEGVHGTPQGLKKEALLSGITQNMRQAAYGCALPPFVVRFTEGMQETFYVRNILSLPENYIVASFSSFYTKDENGYNVNPTTVTTGNGYLYSVYDSCFAKIEGNMNAGESFIVKADAIGNCSALVIGDSTVARGTMTQKMLDAFTERGKTLTLLGTLGTSPNNNEGRAGWSTSTYMSGSSYDGVVNPFYNPTTETFDFAYYMGNQNYNAVDFVVIQLGINDLYSTSFDNVESIIDGAINNICAMIDSILAFNSSQKILLNLPTPCNTDYSVALADIPPITMAKYIMYNQKIQLVVTKYGASKVRCSNCHLILDGSADIDDHVHPTTEGFAKMANEVVSQINVWQNGG